VDDRLPPGHPPHHAAVRRFTELHGQEELDRASAVIERIVPVLARFDPVVGKTVIDPARAIGPSQYILNVAVFDTLVYVHPKTWEARTQARGGVGGKRGRHAMDAPPARRRHLPRRHSAHGTGPGLQLAVRVATGARSNAYSRLTRTVGPGSIAAADDLTLVIQMNEPDALLPYALGLPQLAIVRDGTSEFTADNTIGPGSFKLEQWTAG
jgi:hypothetical protein